MDKLSRLLHELIEHAAPQGNRRGELHALADEAVAELAPPSLKPAQVAPAVNLAVPFAPPAKPSGTQAV